MREVQVSGLVIRWTVLPGEVVKMVCISGMHTETLEYGYDMITREITYMSLVKDKAFVKGVHAVLRRLSLMEKRTVSTGTGLFRKEVNRRFFTPEFLRD